MVRKTVFFREPVLGMKEFTDVGGKNVRVIDQAVEFSDNGIDFVIPLSNVLFITQDFE